MIAGTTLLLLAMILLNFRSYLSMKFSLEMLLKIV